jgi:hypothetical protein
MATVMVFKCEETGKLFEFEADYLTYCTKRAEAAETARAREEAPSKRDAIMGQILAEAESIEGLVTRLKEVYPELQRLSRLVEIKKGPRPLIAAQQPPVLESLEIRAFNFIGDTAEFEILTRYTGVVVRDADLPYGVFGFRVTGFASVTQSNAGELYHHVMGTRVPCAQIPLLSQKHTRLVELIQASVAEDRAVRESLASLMAEDPELATAKAARAQAQQQLDELTKTISQQVAQLNAKAKAMHRRPDLEQEAATLRAALHMQTCRVTEVY